MRAHPILRGLKLAAKFYAVLVVLAVIALAVTSLKFRPPVPPEPSLYRALPGLAKLRFFSTGGRSLADRYGYVERTQFTHSETQGLYTTIHWEDPALKTLTEIRVRVVYYRSDGSIFTENNSLEQLNPSYSNFTMYTAVGRDPSSLLPPDVYHVEAYINETLIAVGEFVVVAG